MAAVWIVLKWTGLVLAGILLLLVLICLLLLFAPVKYKVQCKKEEALDLRARVRFLFPLFSLCFQYVQGKPKLDARILGIRVFSLDRKKRKERKKKEGKKKENQRKRDKTKDKDHNINSLKDRESFSDDLICAPGEDGKIAGNEIICVPGEDGRMTGNEHKSFFHKLREIFRQICAIIKQCVQQVKKIISMLQDIRQDTGKSDGKTEGNQTLWSRVADVVQAEETKAFLKLTKREGLKLLAHIRPRKVKGYVHFGMQDPATTGYILGGIAILMPLHQNFLRIIPDFENACLETDVEAKGCIRLYKVLLFVKAWYFTVERKKFMQVLEK